jgi:hypothetical protein
MTDTPSEVAFDIDYPVVDHTTVRQICDGGRSVRIAATYFHPIMNEVVKGLTGRDRSVWPVFARAWEYAEPVDFGDEELVLEFDDGIVEQLRLVRDRGFDLDLSKVYGAGGSRPTPAAVVVSALIDFLEDSFGSGVQVGVLVT